MEDPGLFLAAIETELRRALPAGVAVVTHVASASLPIPENERKIVVRAVASRQAEFVAGRWCAHRALEKIGCPAEILAVGPLGAPLWPSQARGSISHESGLCAAAAAPSSLIEGLGIDLIDTSREVDTDGIDRLVTSSADTFSLSSKASPQERTLLCFAVKEAVVKAISAKVGRYLELNEIHTAIGDGDFSARLEKGTIEVAGTWARVGVFFVTTASIPA